MKPFQSNTTGAELPPVGFGITPNHALRLVGYTTGGESHPALKILI